jgi:NADH-quinone oxidoreductase subunit H
VFFLTEYANMILVSFLAPILFLGGWYSPFPQSWGFLGEPAGGGWSPKRSSSRPRTFWFRASFPRYRYDQIMRLGWKVFIPITIVWVFVAGWHEVFRLGHDQRLSRAMTRITNYFKSLLLLELFAGSA